MKAHILHRKGEELLRSEKFGDKSRMEKVVDRYATLPLWQKAALTGLFAVPVGATLLYAAPALGLGTTAAMVVKGAAVGGAAGYWNSASYNRLESLHEDTAEISQLDAEMRKHWDKERRKKSFFSTLMGSIFGGLVGGLLSLLFPTPASASSGQPAHTTMPPAPGGSSVQQVPPPTPSPSAPAQIQPVAPTTGAPQVVPGPIRFAPPPDIITFNESRNSLWSEISKRFSETVAANAHRNHGAELARHLLEETGKQFGQGSAQYMQAESLFNNLPRRITGNEEFWHVIQNGLKIDFNEIKKIIRIN